MKPFKDIDQQIKILKQRGLSIPNVGRTKKHLLSNNYYNIVNGYSKFFQIENTDKYIAKATFDEIVALYTFDKDVKRAILQAILDAEHHIKSITAHRFAEAHPGERYAYLNTANYDSEKLLDVGYTISRLSKIINLNKRHNGNTINHYVRNHKDVPIWVITDYLEFGDLRSITFNLPVETQNIIARDLTSFIKSNIPDFSGQFQPEVMVSFLKNINQLRNVCAHNNRLLNYKCHANSMYFEWIHKPYSLTGDDARKTVYSTVISLQCFISGEEFNILWNTIRKKVRKLENKIQSININKINTALGFPENWHTGTARGSTSQASKHKPTAAELRWRSKIR